MNEIQLRDSLFELFPPDGAADWDDVLRRGGRRRTPLRKLTLVVALALLVTLAVGSALALSGRLGNLFRGTPVNDLTPRERFLMSEFDMTGKVELIARRNGKAFYVIRRKDGRVCYSIGDARENLTPAQRAERFRFGGSGCIDPRVFPTAAMPVLDQSYYSYHPGDPESRLAGLQGFAADAVDHIGVIGRDNELIFQLPVTANVYTAGKRGFMGARGIVALDKEGRVLWVKCTAMGRSPAPQFPSGGCGKYQNSPPPKLPATKPRPKPRLPRGGAIVQQGSAQGVDFVVRGFEIDADLRNVSPALRALLVFKDGRVTLGCFKVVDVGGRPNATGIGYTERFAPVIRIRPWSPYGPPVRQGPFDGCTMGGSYGHTWNDVRGTHDAVEVPLTARGRRYFTERATARDIAWLARARAFHDIRYGVRPFTSATAARELGPHVLALGSPRATPPLGKLGIWIGSPRRVVLVERTPTGRRLYLDLRHGVEYLTNLIGLA